MILDARDVPATGIAGLDVGIIGAGAAGIALALELESAGLKIALVEAGGFEYAASTQRLLEGETIGDRYPALRDTRLAAVGGSTAVWAGFCRPLDDVDFEARASTTGWPFSLQTMEPYYRRAHDTCRLAEYGYDTTYWASRLQNPPLLVGDRDVRNVVFHVNALRFGSWYRQRLAASPNVELVVNAPVMKLRMATGDGRVAHASVRTLAGHRFDVFARCYVLATGGMENARMLLLSADAPERAPGNANGLVGRYLTDHPFVDPGFLAFSDGTRRMDHYLPQPAGADATGARVRGAFSLDPQLLAREGLLNGAMLVYPRYEAHEAFASDEVKDFLEVISKLRRRSVPGNEVRLLARALRAPHKVAVAGLRKLLVANGPARRWRLRAMFETESRFDNRVTLSDELDDLGRPRARVEWRLSERDLRSMRHFVARMSASFERAGLGRIELGFADDLAGWRAAAIGGKHHMGTTRMHRDATLGVVDADSRVHGTSNLFVAGSSVFPSGGFANPTLTIVALAIRLADHLRRTLK